MDDDYYAIAGVDRTAPREAIDQAIRKQLRLWQRRASTSDLVRRQEAERRVRQLSQALTVLLDEPRRQRYDQQLEAPRTPSPPANPVPAPGQGSVPGPVPAPPARPMRQPPRRAWQPQSLPMIEFVHAPLARAVALVQVLGLSTYLLLLVTVGVHPMSALLLLFGIGSWVAASVRERSRARVALTSYGVVLYGAESIPWTKVRAIEESEVDGVARVVVRTADGSQVLLPAPRRWRLLTGDLGFAGKLEQMRQWHAHYRPQ